MNIWFKNGEKAISITFDKELIKYGIKKYETKDSIKHVDTIYQKSISIFGLIFTYGDFNYNEICYITLENNKKYSKSKNNKAITVLKEVLLENVKKKYNERSSMPFNWNFSFNADTGEIVYFITGKKKWFEENHFEDLVNDMLNSTVNRDFIVNNINKFPKYNLHNTTSVIEYIKHKNKEED